MNKDALSARELKRWHGEDLNVFEVGQRDRQSHIPAEILSLLQFLDRPHSPDNLKAALLVLVGRRLIPSQDLNALVTFPEQFLYPAPLDPPQSATSSRSQSLLRQSAPRPIRTTTLSANFVSRIHVGLRLKQSLQPQISCQSESCSKRQRTR